MTPFEAAIEDQERIERNEESYIEWNSLGATDAAFGELPMYANDAYLAGYVRVIKTLPVNPDGTIIRRLPAPVEQQFDEF